MAAAGWLGGERAGWSASRECGLVGSEGSSCLCSTEQTSKPLTAAGHVVHRSLEQEEAGVEVRALPLRCRQLVRQRGVGQGGHAAAAAICH